MQSGKLNTGSRIQTFLRCFALSFDFALSSQNLPMEALQELSMMKLLLKKKKSDCVVDSKLSTSLKLT